MLIGLWDHWVPSDNAVSIFWKTPFEELRPELDRLLSEVAVNNFTFYTKWYSNGLKSSLPFLVNDPESMNVQTNNEWGRQLIDYFHDRGITVTAVLQCYTLEKAMLPQEAVLGVWQGLTNVTGASREVAIVDPCWDGYGDLLRQMVSEQLELFPGLDGFFFEFEGLSAIPEKDLRRERYRVGKPSVSAEVRALWDDVGIQSIHNQQWVWDEQNQQCLSIQLGEQLRLLEDLFAERAYQGLRGLVYHAFGYEVPYAHRVLPSKEWWLLPWHYWGWDFAKDDDDAKTRREIDFCKRKFRQYKDQGHKLCYIGNATLPTNRPETITELVEFSREIDADGYLGMGNPMPRYGLRWHHATEESVYHAREIYKALFPKT